MSEQHSNVINSTLEHDAEGARLNVAHIDFGQCSASAGLRTGERPEEERVEHGAAERENETVCGHAAQ